MQRCVRVWYPRLYIMNELECEVSGVIREICVDNGEPVEFGQVLFRVSP